MPRLLPIFAAIALSAHTGATLSSQQREGAALAPKASPGLAGIANTVTQVADTARLSAVAARAAASEVYARLNAEAAEASSARSASNSKEAMKEVQAARSDLRGTIAAAQAAAVGAKAVEDELAWAQHYAQEIEKQAASDAATAVRQRLGGVMKEFAEWKVKLLHDPTTEALKAGAKAAAPYQQMVLSLNHKVAMAGREESRLRTQAAMRAEAAEDMKEDADFREKAEDEAGARQARSAAEKLDAEAADLKRQGEVIEVELHKLRADSAAYQDAAVVAAGQAAHMTSPDVYGPPLAAVGPLPVLPR